MGSWEHGEPRDLSRVLGGAIPEGWCEVTRDEECEFCGANGGAVIGIELRDKFDGVICFRCVDCDAVWDRWVDLPSGIATHVTEAQRLLMSRMSPMYPEARRG
jgi:hypothetical protein